MKTYDPGKVVVSFAGNLIGGYAEGTFISAERVAPSFSDVAGASGEVCRVRSRDKRGRVTLTLMGSSLSNDVLSAIMAADELAGTGIGPLFIKDLNGTTLLSATNAWLERPANVEFANELSNREWVLMCESLEIFAGGNA